MAAHSGMEVSSDAQTMLPRAATDPTERSIPPVRITSSIPIEITPVLATWRSTFSMLRLLKKLVEMKLATSTRTTKMAMVL